MNSLLLVAHGSRREQSNEEVRLLAEKLRERCGENYPVIHAAFLEIANPLIPAGLQKCIDAGSSKITVLPYFLNTGRHVAEDIPEIVEAFKQNAVVEINIATHLGASEMMLDLLVNVAVE